MRTEFSMRDNLGTGLQAAPKDFLKRQGAGDSKIPDDSLWINDGVGCGSLR